MSLIPIGYLLGSMNGHCATALKIGLLGYQGA
jgi:hypothetical protein